LNIVDSFGRLGFPLRGEAAPEARRKYVQNCTINELSPLNTEQQHLDRRDPDRVRHAMFEIVMSRASAIACGHEATWTGCGTIR
jgi:hypothetical protein